MQDTLSNKADQQKFREIIKTAILLEKNEDKESVTQLKHLKSKIKMMAVELSDPNLCEEEIASVVALTEESVRAELGEKKVISKVKTVSSTKGWVALFWFFVYLPLVLIAAFNFSKNYLPSINVAFRNVIKGSNPLYVSGFQNPITECGVSCKEDTPFLLDIFLSILEMPYLSDVILVIAWLLLVFLVAVGPMYIFEIFYKGSSKKRTL